MVSLRDRAYLHLHVPKCGGQMFGELLARSFGHAFGNDYGYLHEHRYDAEYVRRVFEHFAFRCFASHRTSCIALDALTDRELHGIAFVRRPDRRILSWYHYVRRLGYRSAQHVEKRVSFEEFVDLLPRLIAEDSHYSHMSQVGWLTWSAGPPRIATLERWTNDDRLMLLPLERFDESLVLLEHAFPNDFRDLSYAHRANRSHYDPQMETVVDDRGFDFVAEDRALVEFANGQLDSLLERHVGGPEAQDEAIRGFRRRCMLRLPGTRAFDVLRDTGRRLRRWLL